MKIIVKWWVTMLAYLLTKTKEFSYWLKYLYQIRTYQHDYYEWDMQQSYNLVQRSHGLHPTLATIGELIKICCYMNEVSYKTKIVQFIEIYINYTSSSNLKYVYSSQICKIFYKCSKTYPQTISLFIVYFLSSSLHV